MLRHVTVTCRTDGCANEGEPITLTIDEDVTAFACGVCGQSIDAAS